MPAAACDSDMGLAFTSGGYQVRRSVPSPNTMFIYQNPGDGLDAAIVVATGPWKVAGIICTAKKTKRL